ncbi:hypothetical protein RRG08_042455 [Elysia crispata]|uniref:Uncharacterized protein n=1 Tax=Elysia crispata TaxID=231223 RepID=A0AAE0ZE16_9GAST|nr:hypothetical protein RRG08_042455 [Elysia crispata]
MFFANQDVQCERGVSFACGENNSLAAGAYLPAGSEITRRAARGARGSPCLLGLLSTPSSRVWISSSERQENLDKHNALSSTANANKRPC